MPEPLTPDRLAEIRRRLESAEQYGTRSESADISDLLAEVERLRPAESFRCHHCGGEFREAPAMTMAALSNEPYPSTPPDPLCHDCALAAVDGSRVRELEAEVQRLGDPWRRTAEEKPPNAVSVILRRTDGTCAVGFWCEGDNEFFTGEIFEKPEVYPHWMAMDALPKPKGDS